ncbi:MAG: metal-dependent transcriptional regulator, partial [Bacillati bacterium ANGP1]
MCGVAYKGAGGERAPLITGVMEDYLKAIYRLQQAHGSVATSELAKELRVAAATTTAMVQRLARLKLVSYHRYRGLTLTSAGERIALETIRHHRLLELYLAQHLGVGLDKV